MNLADVIAHFDELAERKLPQFSEPSVYLTRRRTSSIGRDPIESQMANGKLRYEHREAVQWVAEAEWALKSVFGVADPLSKRWDSIFLRANQTPYYLSDSQTVESAQALIRTARSLLRSGRLASIVESVRAETVVELLDRADELLAEGAPLPAVVVLVGGALETHLRHLCDRADPTHVDPVWSKPGSLSAYKDALDRARKSGNEVIHVGDGKQVIAWADRRNLAAHKPLELKISQEEARLMIEGVRQFVARTTVP